MRNPSNTWFSGPTQVLNPNGSSIGSAVFAGLTSVTDRPTDHATRWVRIGRIYVRSTAMRPKKFRSKILSHIINVQSQSLMMSVGKSKSVYISLIII